MTHAKVCAVEPRVSKCLLLNLLCMVSFVVLVAGLWHSVPNLADDVHQKCQTPPKSTTGHQTLSSVQLSEHDDASQICNLKSAMPKKGRQVHLIAYIGVEGTGHHLIYQILKSTVDVVFSSQNARKFFDMMSIRFRKSTDGKGGDHIPKKLFQSLDAAAAELDLVIDGSPKSSTTFAFGHFSNPFCNILFSGMDPIDLVELTNRSRHNVSLSMIILHRNWTKIIWSTALSRKFGSVARKVNELKESAMVLNAQLASVPLCSWRTFDIDDYPTHPDEHHEAFAKFLHLNASAVKRSFTKVTTSFIENKTTNFSKYDTLWTPEDLSYVHDAFYRPLVTPSWGRLTDSRYKLLAGFDEVGCHSCG